MTKVEKTCISRRHILKTASSVVLLSSIPLTAFAEDNKMRQAILATYGDKEINEGKINVKLPPISENGYSVPLDILVESPMTAENYVKSISVFSPRNPTSKISQFYLSPRNGIAAVSTRIRLAGTQRILVIAELNDGSLWSGSYETMVTLAACIIM